MGNNISEQNFSENALESTVIQDQLLLSYDVCGYVARFYIIQNITEYVN